MTESGKSVEIDGIQFFTSARHKGPANRAEADVAIQYLGHLRFYARGAERWGEVCRRRGMAEKARRAKVGLIAEEGKLVLVPAPETDLSGAAISWTVRQRSGEIRLRSAFLHYGITMQRQSVWMLKAVAAKYPEVGWAMVVDLSEWLEEARMRKRAAGGRQ